MNMYNYIFSVVICCLLLSLYKHNFFEWNEKILGSVELMFGHLWLILKTYIMDFSPVGQTYAFARNCLRILSLTWKNDTEKR